MPKAVIGSWEGSLAIRFPSDMAQAAGLKDGQPVEIIAESDTLIIRKLSPDATTNSMFRGKSAEDWRKLYADACDWGPDRGRERLEE